MDHHSQVFQASPDAPRVTPPEEPAGTSLRRTLADAWAMIRPYWSSEDRWAAWGLLLAVVLLTLGMVYINVLFNRWNSAFFNALQDRNQTVFLAQLFRVSWLIAVFILLAVYQLYLSQMLEIRWRRWLTDHYLRAWLADGAYYRMQLVARRGRQPRPAHRRRPAPPPLPHARTVRRRPESRRHPGDLRGDPLGAVRNAHRPGGRVP
jgi:ABC-type uncharacterized transport system fused permease/ATPase subunit